MDSLDNRHYINEMNAEQRAIYQLKRRIKADIETEIRSLRREGAHQREKILGMILAKDIVTNA